MASDNPYRAPVADERDVGAPLFSPFSIAAHTFVFTPLLGGAMAAINYARTGNTARAWQTIGLAVGACVIMMLVAWLLPSNLTPGIVGGSAALGIGWKREMDRLVLPEYEKGRQRAAWWLATLAGVALVALAWLAIFAVVD